VKKGSVHLVPENEKYEALKIEDGMSFEIFSILLLKVLVGL